MSDPSFLAAQVLRLAAEKKLSIVTAESCTAGKLCALLSEQVGAGSLLQGAFVTYTKNSKAQALGVPLALLQAKSAVCCEVATAMARGALSRSPADFAIAITGVAGPEPDEDGNPVGLVCIGLAAGEKSEERRFDYGALGRARVQQRAMADALRLLLEAMRGA